MLSIFTTALIALAPAPATSAAPPSICKAFGDQIESDLQDLAEIDADEITDNSAPRATMRADRQIVKLETIRANIDLMSAHHCAPYAHTVSSHRYFLPATQCQLDILNSVKAGKSGVPDTCSRANWKPSGE